jgi:hypothetical protein
MTRSSVAGREPMDPSSEERAGSLGGTNRPTRGAPVGPRPDVPSPHAPPAPVEDPPADPREPGDPEPEEDDPPLDPADA